MQEVIITASQVKLIDQRRGNTYTLPAVELFKAIDAYTSQVPGLINIVKLSEESKEQRNDGDDGNVRE